MNDLTAKIFDHSAPESEKLVAMYNPVKNGNDSAFMGHKKEFEKSELVKEFNFFGRDLSLRHPKVESARLPTVTDGIVGTDSHDR